MPVIHASESYLLEPGQNRNYTCPVCAYSALPYPPERDEICLCCGTHFGYDDAGTTHRELRNNWLRMGGHWFSPVDPAPESWNAWHQLSLADFDIDVPEPTGETLFKTNTRMIVKWFDVNFPVTIQPRLTIRA